jgi:uncharacterized membrane protein
MSMVTAVWAMIAAGMAALIAGLVLVRRRFASVTGAGKVLVLGPVFEAVALAIFSAEHFWMARELMGIVPSWLPGALFWTYLVGIALLAAAVSFIVWRHVGLSALLLALLFLIIVVTVDLPNLPKHIHERLFWTLTVRETVFAGGAMVLAGSVWAQGKSTGRTLIQTLLMRTGRFIVAGTLLFYAVQHFLFPLFVPGVPLEKMIPAWMPVPALLSCFVGIVLLGGGVGLMISRARRISAATVGSVLALLTVFFYVPILVTEIGSPLAVEGVNYVGDTLLFAATALLAGFSADLVEHLKPEGSFTPHQAAPGHAA